MIGTAIPEEPFRNVVGIEFFPRPRGGVVILSTLECGHIYWRRAKHGPQKPGKRPVRCTGCWLDIIRGGRR